MLKTRVPPPCYAFCAAWVLWLMQSRLPGLKWVGEPWNLLGWSLIVLGTGIDCWGALAFLRNRTTMNPMRPDRARRLMVSGPYRFSRNPMYLGLVLSLCGWIWVLGMPLLLPAVWLFARLLEVVQIAPEEAALEARFGVAYRRYSRQVHRWLGGIGDALADEERADSR